MRPLLICYLPVGDPECAAATPSFYVDHGVDVIEAGIPVPDPVLDGPEVTGSMARALAAGFGADQAADELAHRLTAAGFPYAVWMSYESDPDEGYLTRVARSGASAVLLPDADPVVLQQRSRKAGLEAIPFLNHPPSVTEVAAATEAGGRYVMLAAAAGQTGERPTVGDDNRALIAGLRAQGVATPIALGFGISGPDQARAALELGADGVIVGSACVRAARVGPTALEELLTGIREALDDC